LTEARSATTESVHAFEEVFARAPTVVVDAPGRVNLIGEHTDYNGGFVLPIQIPQKTRVEVALADEKTVRVSSANHQSAQYELGQERKTNDWIDYIQGITAALLKQNLSIVGFDARISSSVPEGSGVSSSASLEISMLRALRSLFHLPLNDVEIALVAHSAENDFVGARVGVMDQFVVSLGTLTAALFLDTQSLKYEHINLPQEIEIGVIDSGIPHTNRAGNYNIRRQECEKACALLGVSLLRELSLKDLPRISQLPMPFSKRARHVVTENQRVIDTADALKTKDLVRFGELLNESHASMRDDYEVSVPQMDLLVEIAQHQNGVLGARMTGGGFGGAMIFAAKENHAAAAGENIILQFRKQTGRNPVPLVLPQNSPHIT
jgi:galactokinase